MSARGANGLPGVQALRGLAAFLVLVHHVLEESQPLFGERIPAPLVMFGASGVDLFFVISGFIMYYTNQGRFGKDGAPVDFLIRRVIRIVPLYWLCTFVLVAAKIAGFYAHYHITAHGLIFSLLFLPNPNIVLGAGWTLNYEMYFYTVISIWLFCSTSRSGTFGIIGSIPLITFMSWSLPPSTMRTFLGNPIALEFCFGMALGVAFTEGWISTQVSRAALLVGAAGLVLGATFGPRSGTAGLAPEVRFLFWGLPAAVLLMSALSVAEAKGRFGKALLALGDASYSIYLTHPFVMTMYARILKAHPGSSIPRPIWMVVPILVSLAVGLGTYSLVERPMNARLKLWWKRGSSSRTAIISGPTLHPIEDIGRSSTMENPITVGASRWPAIFRRARYAPPTLPHQVP
jgi:exopolysaccharide production protein ExoZ